MKVYILIPIVFALMVMSAALGWCSNGYFIYRGIVGNMEGAIQMPMGKSNDKPSH